MQKWSIGRKEKAANRASRARYGGPSPSSIFVFALYPNREPVHRLVFMQIYLEHEK